MRAMVAKSSRKCASTQSCSTCIIACVVTFTQRSIGMNTDFAALYRVNDRDKVLIHHKANHGTLAYQRDEKLVHGVRNVRVDIIKSLRSKITGWFKVPIIFQR